MPLRNVLHAMLQQRTATFWVWLLLVLPFAWLLVAALSQSLGPNPAEALIRQTGIWTLRLLTATLCISPLREYLGLPLLLRFRRPLGLACFAYAGVHLLCYVLLDQGGALEDIVRDVFKRPFIFMGMVAFSLMIPLAMTSSRAALRWLGGYRWQRVHSLIYILAVVAVIHFFWMRAGKNDFAQVWCYALALGTLLSWRVWRAINKAGRKKNASHHRHGAG